MSSQETEKKKIAGKDFEIFPAQHKDYSENEKFIQTVVLGFWLAIAIFLTMVLPFLLIYWFIIAPYSRIPLVLYYGWMVYDKEGPNSIRISKFMMMNVRYSSIWKHFRNYFKGQLVKTAELDPKKKYIFGVHPHGVYAISCLANIFHNTEFHDAFPGINVISSTLPSNFWIPIWRDYIMSMGAGSSSPESIRGRINDGSPGTAMIIAVGGAAEFKHMKKGCMDLVLKNRKGFCKMALQTGADLVPVISFHENDVYELVTHKAFQPLHSVFRFFFNSSAPLFVGRNWGFPERHPLITVVGKPIAVEKIEHPTASEISKLHGQYLLNIRELYDDFKDKFDPHRKKDIDFI